MQKFITAQEFNERKKQSSAPKSAPASSSPTNSPTNSPTSSPSSSSKDDSAKKDSARAISGHVDATQGADGKPADAVMGADKLLEEGLKAQNASSAQPSAETPTQTGQQTGQESNPVAVLSLTSDPSTEARRRRIIPAAPESDALFQTMAAKTTSAPLGAATAGTVTVKGAQITKVESNTIIIKLKFSAPIELTIDNIRVCKIGSSYPQCPTVLSSILSIDPTSSNTEKIVGISVSWWGGANDGNYLAISHTSIEPTEDVVLN